MARDKHTIDEFPLLKGLGLKAVHIIADGNCQYSAFSDQVYGNTSRHGSIRAEVVAYMKDHANEFKAFINYDGKKRSSRRKAACTRIRSAEPSAEELETKINTAWETYLASISKTRAWGDHLTIRAFACAYGRVVRVYQKEGHYDITPDVNGGHPIVHIAYHDWRHYSSIRSLDGSPVSLPDASLPAEEANAVEGWMANATTSLRYSTNELSIERSSLDSASTTANASFDEFSMAPSTAPTSPSVSTTPPPHEQSSQDSEYDEAPRNQSLRRRILTFKNGKLIRTAVHHTVAQSPDTFTLSPSRSPARKRKALTTDDIPFLDLNELQSTSPKRRKQDT